MPNDTRECPKGWACEFFTTEITECVEKIREKLCVLRVLGGELQGKPSTLDTLRYARGMERGSDYDKIAKGVTRSREELSALRDLLNMIGP